MWKFIFVFVKEWIVLVGSLFCVLVIVGVSLVCSSVMVLVVSVVFFSRLWWESVVFRDIGFFFYLLLYLFGLLIGNVEWVYCFD